MNAVRIEAMDPLDPRALQAVNSFLNEMVERVDANALTSDPADESEGYVEQGFFLVAMDDHNRVVGCGALEQVGDGLGQIRRMWVNPVLRGRSIGRRLLSALEGAAAVAGLDVIRLEAYEGLTEAILLYETSGYVRSEPEEGAPADLRFYEKHLEV
ncbi:MAG: GNAT family N-acetyltransferase [Actinomycetota bacterium]|nr:GNAT family N-acetyltransferase [Actinomycetota bacterium]MDH5278576.1 GNAT family N-acetyltransferase [Actinomycetota bacterium]